MKETQLFCSFYSVKYLIISGKAVFTPQHSKHVPAPSWSSKTFSPLPAMAHLLCSNSKSHHGPSRPRGAAHTRKASCFHTNSCVLMLDFHSCLYYVSLRSWKEILTGYWGWECLKNRGRETFCLEWWNEPHICSVNDFQWRVLVWWLFFGFLGPHVQHMEVPRLGAESEPQLLAYATATQDPSCVCDLHHSSRQHRILNRKWGQGRNLRTHGY